MFNPASFVTCVQDGLKQRGFGHKRVKEITDKFEARMDAHLSDGMDVASAGQLAMKETFDRITVESTERAKRTAAMLSVQAANIKTIQAGVDAPVSLFVMDGKKGSRGTALARAAV